ncbi:MAG: hypothetical protein E7139_03055 [Rikenellaceae bacterium]|nr:hypothetical protein [Rikenellaceae bacterium]
MRKTIFTLGLMLAAALSLTNCTKNEEANFTPEVKVPFELFANLESRTTNDGMSTKWANGDQINVFHAVAGTPDYVNDTPFVEADNTGTPFVTDGTGTFKGTLAEELDQTKAYDWYALYPYKSYITTPAEQTEGYVYIGSKSNEVQTQNGNDSMAHIAGKNYPLVGVVKNVPASEKPAITMSHISSLVEFNVTNKLTEDITVTSIALTALEHIVGTYYIDFTGEKIDYTPGPFTSQTATLNVSNGTAIKPGESAKFYMAIKPTEFDGDNILITVNAKTANGTGTMEIEKEVETAFYAGKMKTLKIGFNAEIEEAAPEVWSLLTSPTQITNGTYVFVAKQKNGTTISYLPNTTASAKNVLQVNTTLFDLTTSVLESIVVPADARWTLESTGTDGQYYITNPDGNYLYATNSNNGMVVGDTEDSWTIATHSNNANAFTLKDKTNSRYLTLYSTTNWRCYTSPYDYDSTKDQNGEIYIYYCGKLAAVPSIIANNISDVPAEGVEDATTAFSAQNLTEDIVVTCDGDVVTDAAIIESTITYSVSENTTSAAREGWIQLAANGVVTKITVSQKGATQTVTINQVTSAGNYVVTGTVVAVGNQAYIIGDNTGVMMVYHSNSGRTVGENITISGAVTIYKSGTSFGTPQFTNAATVTVNSEGNTWSYNPTVLDSAGVGAMLNETLAQEVQIAGKYVVSGNYVNIEIDGTTTQGSIKYVDNSLYASFSGKNVIVKGYFVGVSSGKYVNILPYSIVEDESVTPEPEPEPTPDPEDPTPGTGGGTDDFATIDANTSYGTYKTTAGWNCVNCCVLRGGTSNSNPNFTMFGETTTHAICMNGKTSAVGKITSPILTAGCGTLEFNYGIPYSDSKIKFKVEIMQNGAVVKTFTVDKTSVTKFTVYSHKEEAVNVAGDFQIVFTNLCPSSNSSSNKDRTAIWNVKWTGYNN